jgi:hypothetical protein
VDKIYHKVDSIHWAAGAGSLILLILFADHHHAATAAFDFFDITGVAEAVGRLDDPEIMKSEPAQESEQGVD